jgi:3-methyladenine DNA glycosylase/8-oxoguanine DNA glycosylase
LNRFAFSIDPTPPFRLDLTVWTLCRRPGNIVDRWDGKTYRRALVAGGHPLEVEVEQMGSPDAPRLKVRATSAVPFPGAGSAVRNAVERILGAQIDLGGFYRLAASDPALGPVVTRFRGAKPPRFPTLFETLANAITCQQLSLTVGILLLNRLVDACGAAIPGRDPAVHAFPSPEDVAALVPETLRSMGFSRQKARALLELAGIVAGKRIDLDGIASLEDEEAVDRLRELRGVGRWTAEYVLLRGLGRIHVFPGDDVGARNHLQRWLGKRKTLDYEGVRSALSRWEPYAGLVYFHLLLKGISEAGWILTLETIE